jgi:hypothetical protein
VKDVPNLPKVTDFGKNHRPLLSVLKLIHSFPDHHCDHSVSESHIVMAETGGSSTVYSSQINVNGSADSAGRRAAECESRPICNQTPLMFSNENHRSHSKVRPEVNRVDQQLHPPHRPRRGTTAIADRLTVSFFLRRVLRFDIPDCAATLKLDVI